MRLIQAPVLRRPSKAQLAKASRRRSSAQPPPPQRITYSVREVAALTGLGRSTIYVLLGQKKLTSLRVGGRRLIPHDALVALLGGE